MEKVFLLHIRDGGSLKEKIDKSKNRCILFVYLQNNRLEYTSSSPPVPRRLSLKLSLGYDRKTDEMTRRTIGNLLGIIVGLFLLAINPKKIVSMVRGGQMHYFRGWVGSIVFALGVAGIVWFIRNLVRDRTRRAFGFSKHPFLYFAIIIGFVIGGLWIYSGFERIPFIPVLGGIIIGWFFLNKIIG